jgi:type I restriction enzyme S subunit
VSRIDDLIKQLCPGGVPVKTLDEIGSLVRGNGMPKTDFTDAGVGAIHYGQIYMHYGTWATETISFVAPETAARLAKVDPGDVIITNTSENVEDVGKAVAWLGNETIVTGGHATVLKRPLNSKYIAYWLQSPQFDAQKRKLAIGTKVIDISAKTLGKVRVPFPPAEVQEEIVRVLDDFRALDEQLGVELRAELAAREKQYSFYRDFLLTDHDETHDTRWIALGEIGEFVRGNGVQKKDLVESGVPAIHYGEIHTHYGMAASTTRSYVTPEFARKLRKAEPGDLVIATTSEDDGAVGKAVAWLGDTPAAVSSDAYIYRHSLVPKYAAYFFQSRGFHDQKMRGITGTKVRRISGDSLAKIKVLVPPLSVQEEIVAVLDSLQLLKTKLAADLRIELEARRKQYATYRDRLLTFEEVTA